MLADGHESAQGNSQRHRWSLFRLPLSDIRAHNGDGLIKSTRIAARGQLSSACNFIDYTCMPPDTSIGTHTHSGDNEEFYLILEGSGIMFLNGETFTVAAGDLIRNPPSGTHGLVNPGPGEMKLLVFELPVPMVP